MYLCYVLSYLLCDTRDIQTIQCCQCLPDAWMKLLVMGLLEYILNTICRNA